MIGPLSLSEGVVFVDAMLEPGDAFLVSGDSVAPIAHRVAEAALAALGVPLPFAPDVARALPELVETRARLPHALPQVAEPEERSVWKTEAIFADSIVGAIGIEPTTPTVSSHHGVCEDTQVSVIPSIAVAVSVPVGAPRDDRGNERGNSEPSDAELERGVLDAVRLGLAEVARTLSAQLEERRRARMPGNVTPIGSAKRVHSER